MEFSQASMLSYYKKALVDAEKFDKRKKKDFYTSNYFSEYGYPNDLLDTNTAVTSKAPIVANNVAKIPQKT